MSPRFQPGVPSPYTVALHPYPTRFHGGIWTRPVFGMPYVQSPQSVFKPDDFYPDRRYPWPQAGLGADQILTMPPETAAKLSACFTDCDKKYGVPSGRPDVFSLVNCQAMCNANYPPTVQLPGGGSVTPTIPGTIPGVVSPASASPDFPQNAVEPNTVTKAGMSSTTKAALAVAAVAAVAGGIYYWKKRKG